MRYLVATDIHGNIDSANLLLSIFKKEKIDKVILLGDLYHSGLLTFTNNEVIDILNSIADKIICTRGNCDTSYDVDISNFTILDKLMLKIKDKIFMFTHGDRYNIDNIDNIDSNGQVDYLIYGHTHKNNIIKRNNVICINLSSISYPCGMAERSYMIIDDDIRIYDFEGNVLEIIDI